MRQNLEVAAAFQEVADRLEIEGENPFRIRAYRNAARTLSELPEDVGTLLARGEDPSEWPAIGDDLAEKIREFVETGHLSLLDRLRRRQPEDLTQLLEVPGLGPRRVRALYRDLDVHNLEQLARAARDGRIRTLPGFGEKTEVRILQAVESRLAAPRRYKLSFVTPQAEALAGDLAKVPGVATVTPAGSLRRSRETIGDIDLLAVATDGAAAIARFADHPDVRQVLAQGETRASVVLKSGIQADLRVVAPDSYGAALHYFTGSKAHNIAIRTMGQLRGLKINEYGVFRGAVRIAGETEESVFASVGLPFIAPELREDRGEIEAARAGLLPRLVELADLRGDLHAHTTATDGRSTLREMAEAARRRGHEYLAITEHSRRLGMARGFDARRLLAQMDEIDRLNRDLRGITLLKGIEVDILDDGTLDLPDEVLARLEIVVGAVHSRFNFSRLKQTERLLKALDNPCLRVLAHPTGQLLLEREPYDVDMPRVLRQARDRGCAVEINAQPERLDLLDVHCREAKDLGVLLCINSDAHSVAELDDLRYGVGQARRGWLTAADVLNTRPLADVRAWLRTRALPRARRRAS